jgi:hypothetical protein
MVVGTTWIHHDEISALREKIDSMDRKLKLILQLLEEDDNKEIMTTSSTLSLLLEQADELARMRSWSRAFSLGIMYCAAEREEIGIGRLRTNE